MEICEKLQKKTALLFNLISVKLDARYITLDTL